MERVTKPKILPSLNASGGDQSTYEPAKNWRPLREHVLAEGKRRYGVPIGDAYEFDITDGWFFKKGFDKKTAMSNGDAFNIIGLMCASGDEDRIICGNAPREKYDEIANFWKNAAQDFASAIVAGDIRVWARNGGIAAPFRPVAVDTWEKALAATVNIDGSYGSHDLASWIASCIYWDKFLGVPSLDLCSFFSERMRERREITSEREMIGIIEEAERITGRLRLDVRTLKKLCAEKCSNVSQETFLKVEGRLRGPRNRGRGTKQSK